MLMANQVSFAAVKPPSVFRKLLGNEVMNLFCKGVFFFLDRKGQQARRKHHARQRTEHTPRKPQSIVVFFFPGLVIMVV